MGAELSVSWLADRVTEVEFRDDGVGLIGVGALVFGPKTYKRVQHALKAGGVSHTNVSWAGTFLIRSSGIAEGRVAILAPFELTLEGIYALFIRVSHVPLGDFYATVDEGRARIISV